MIRDGFVVVYRDGRLRTVPALICDEPIPSSTEGVSDAKVLAFPERMAAVVAETTPPRPYDAETSVGATRHLLGGGW